MQRKHISFEGQRIFIGIDVHKRNWSVAVSTETGCVRTHSQKASAQTLLDFLKGNYPGADYLAVYEAGFTGFSTYYALTGLGINCLVIHAADVPTSQYESVMKNRPLSARIPKMGCSCCLIIWGGRAKAFLADSDYYHQTLGQ